MRSSKARNSAVSSSSLDLEGCGWGKGITSDIGRTSLGTNPRRMSFSPAIGAFLRLAFFRRLGFRLNYFQFGFGAGVGLDEGRQRERIEAASRREKLRYRTEPVG
jgi:hypothetical protein